MAWPYITPYILGAFYKIQPGKYLPGRIYGKYLQNVGRNIHKYPIFWRF